MGIVPACVDVRERHVLNECRIHNQDGPRSGGRLLGTEEDDARETAAMQQNWQELDPSPGYIRYTARIKGGGGGGG